jgi:Tol biopolymer transport system component
VNRVRLAVAAAALLLIAVAVAATAGGGGNSASSTTPSSSPAGGDQTTTGESGHSHDSNIYVLALRSGRLKQLTDGQVAQQPSWRPNKRIAFSAADCDDSCWSQLFYIDSKAVNQVLVHVQAAHHLFHPTWSSDGRLAAVALGRGIFSFKPGQRKPRPLTTGQSDEAPDWSPRSEWIAFDKRVRDTNYDIFAVNAATRKIRRLTHDARQQTNPAWSPDGSTLAFSEQQPSGRWAIVTMQANGSARKRVTGSSVSAQEPAWAPDGKRIAFVKQGLDTASIAVVGSDGKHLRTLTRRSLFVSTPAWSPDGRSIAFAATPTSPPKS